MGRGARCARGHVQGTSSSSTVWTPTADVITRAYTVIDAPEVGQTVRVEIPVGGGGSASSEDDERRNQVPLSTCADVVSWEIGALQPDTIYWLSR